MSNLPFMCFNIYIYATDLYLKVFTERYGDKNYVNFVQIYRTYLYVHVHVSSMCTVLFCVLLIHNALIMLLFVNKIIIWD